MFFQNKRIKFSIRKFTVGVVSTAVSMTALGATLFHAQPVQAQDCLPGQGSAHQISYEYVLESELTEAEKALIIKQLPSQQVGQYGTYYMIYRPKTSLPNAGSQDNAAGLMVGAGLLVVGISLLKGKKKGIVSGLFLLTATGTLTVSAISSGALANYNQSYSLQVGDQLPNQVISIDNYEFVGYIVKEADLDCLPVETSQAPMTEVITSQVPVTETSRQVTVTETEQVTSQAITEAVITSQAPATSTYVTTTEAKTEAVITETLVDIPFDTIYQEDPASPLGTEVVVQVGSPGQRKLVYTNGVLTSDTIVANPVNAIIRRGSYVAPTTETSQVPVETTQPAQTTSEGQVTEPVVTQPPTTEIVVPVEPTRTVSTEVIAFEISYVDDPGLEAGTEIVDQEGVNGIRTITTVDGVVVSSEITQSPVTRIVRRGTKVAEVPVTEEEVKTITRTINLVLADGTPAGTEVQVVTYKRTKTTTGSAITYSEWQASATAFPAYTVPEKANYKTNVTSVPEAPVTVDSSDSSVTVTYSPIITETPETKTVTRTISYVFENDSQASAPVTQSVTYTRTTSTNQVTKEVTHTDWVTDQANFEALTSPILTNYLADLLEVPAVTTNAETTSSELKVTYRPEMTEEPETRTVTRIIHYVYEDDLSKAAEDKEQSLKFTRTKTTNKVTGEVTYSEWTPASQDLEAVTSPLISGFTADQLVVPALTVTADSANTEVTVKYTDKMIEIKDVDEAVLYAADASLGYSKVLSLASAPTDLTNYYVKVNSDRFKEMQLQVTAISEETKDGKAVYKVTATHPELKQDEDYNGYDQNYTFYVAKEDTTLVGIKTFKELVEKITADPTGTYTLADDLTADDVDLPPAQTSYITTTFTGILNGQNGSKNFAIYNLKAPLFATLSAATVTNLDLKNVDIDANYARVASLAKLAEKGTSISNVAVQGDIEASYVVTNYDNSLNTSQVEPKLVVGGIVAQLNASTLNNASFTGKINTDTGHVRFVNNGRLYYQGNVTGGAVGEVWGEGSVRNTKVSADITLAATPYVTAGGLLGSFSSNQTQTLVTNNYVEGSLNNQSVDGTVVKSDGTAVGTGNVGGLFGSVFNGRIQNNMTAMKVTNGKMMTGSGSNIWNSPQIVVEGQASGTAKDSWNSTTQSAAAAEATRAGWTGMTATLDDSNQFITNAFDVDYTQVPGYQASHALAYQNMEKLLPFYNREYLVKQANKLAATDKLVTTELLSATPLTGEAVVSDISGQKTAINRLMLNYADKTVDYKDLSYKGEFRDTKIAEYSIGDTGLLFTTDQFTDSYEGIVAAVLSDLKAVTYDGSDVWTALATTGTQETLMEKLYLRDQFDAVQADLEQILKNVLGTSTVYGDSQKVADYIKANKAELLLGLSYISRWYNIDFATTNIQKIATFQQDFFGKPVETLDWLIEVGSSGYSALNPAFNDRKTPTFVGENNNTETLPDYLEAFRTRFAGNMTAAAWFYNAAKAYIVEAQSYDTAGTQIGTAALYDKLNTMSINTSDITGFTLDYSNMILPLLTATEDKIYIISTMEGIQFGNIDTYVDASLKETNPDLYAANLAAFKAIVDKEAHNQSEYWSMWYRVANADVRDKLLGNKPTWDNYYFKGHGLWSPEYGSTAMESVKDFFGPTGRWFARPNDSEGFSDGTKIVFVNVDALSQNGTNDVAGAGGTGGSIWSHEQVHVWDGSVFLGGKGRRSGLGIEAYAEGFLQAPRDWRIRNSFGLNLYHDYTSETNLFPEYNASPKRFQSAADLQEYAKGMMDVLYVMDYAEAMAIAKLDDAAQATRLTQFTQVARSSSDANTNDVVVGLTAAQLAAMNLTTIADFVDNNISMAREYSAGEIGQSTGFDYYTSYLKANMFSSFYGLAQNDNGVSGGYTFRRAAYELLAEYGYNAGFIAYASGQYANDTAAVNAIFNGTYANMAEFKKAMFQQRIDKLTSLKPIIVTADNKTYTINSYQDLQTTMDSLVTAGNNGAIVNFKRALYIAYKDSTNEFKTSIFG